eukprot:scaffold218754_cov36-Tisochrysis_lutea.AAC.1
MVHGEAIEHRCADGEAARLTRAVQGGKRDHHPWRCNPRPEGQQPRRVHLRVWGYLPLRSEASLDVCVPAGERLISD